MLFLARLFQTKTKTAEAEADARPSEASAAAEERAQDLRFEALDLLARVLIATPRPSADVAEKARSILSRIEAEDASARARASAQQRRGADDARSREGWQL